MSALRVEVENTFVSLTVEGAGPPVLLLHGFPQTRLMWRDIAPRLAARFTVVAADLRGYGESGCPPSAPDHSPYSKRALAADMVQAMAALGFGAFAVAGHDRGGRVAYRLALDHPDAVVKLAVLDVTPTLVAWERADARLALAFWPWSLLAQPAPLPEALIGSAPQAVVDDALSQWGTPAATFAPDIRSAYVRALSQPEHVHAICEEYRAAAGIDRVHDAAVRAARRLISCPVLALWSTLGGLNSWYDDLGGPLGVWRDWAADVEGGPVEAGHFFPEEKPALVADRLEAFLLRP